jgi:hypothetical protein
MDASWIVIVALYLVGMGFFALIGGLGSAAEAFRRWGEHTARQRAKRLSSST